MISKKAQAEFKSTKRVFHFYYIGKTHENHSYSLDELPVYVWNKLASYKTEKLSEIEILS